MKREIIIYIVLFLMSMLNATAQVHLSLDSCMQMAIENNTDMRISALDIEAAQQVRKQVFTKFFPSVDIAAIGFYGLNPIFSMDVRTLAQTDVAKDLLTLLYETIQEEYPEVSSEINLVQRGYTVSAKAMQPIYAGGRIINGYRLSKLGVEAAQLKAEVNKRDVLQQVEDTYWLISGLYKKRSTIAGAFALLDTISNVATTAYNAGLVTKNDLLRVQLKRNEIESKNLQLENGIDLATRLLCVLIGKEYEEGIELDSINTNNISDTPEKENISISNRPETELLNINIKAEKLRKNLTLGESLPTLAIGATGGVSSLFDKSRGNVIGLLYLSVPITGWWETSHKLRQHDISIRKAEIMQADLSEKMELQNRQAYNKLTESLKMLNQYEAAKQLAEENYRVSMANYEAGLSTMSELLESQTILLQAQNDYTDAYINYKSSLRRFTDLNK